MVDDPAVRSVRVALALCDRFEELTRGPNVVSAHKGNAALFGVAGNESELSLRLGEAQQIYPEIWSHLDEARKAFAARNVDVAAFDVVRASEQQFGGGLGAKVDTHYAQHGHGRYGYEEWSKTARFNQGGLQRARLAADALMKVTPEIPWAAIAKAEADDPAAKAFRRATIIKRIWMFGLLGLVVASPFLYVMWQHHEERVKREKWRREAESSLTYAPPPAPAKPVDVLPSDRQKELAASTQKTLDQLDHAVATWPATTSDKALAAVKPGSEACPVSIKLPQQADINSYIATEYTNESFAASDFEAYDAAQGVSVDRIALRAKVARDGLLQLTNGTATEYGVQALEGLDAPFVFVVIDRNVEPSVADTTTIKFVPGEVLGRAYVYSVTEGKIVCATKIDAKSSSPKEILGWIQEGETPSEVAAVLHRDLEIQIRTQLAANLRAVSP